MEDVKLTGEEQKIIECVSQVVNTKFQYTKNSHGCLLIKVDPIIRIDGNELDKAISHNTGISTTTMPMNVPGVYWVCFDE